MMSTPKRNSEARLVARSMRDEIADHAARSSTIESMLWSLVETTTAFPSPDGHDQGRGKTQLRKWYVQADNVSWSRFGYESPTRRFMAGWAACLLMQRRRAMRHHDASGVSSWIVRRTVDDESRSRRSLHADKNPRMNAVAIIHYLDMIPADNDGASFLEKVVSTFPTTRAPNRLTKGIIPRPFAVPTTRRMLVLPVELPDLPGDFEGEASTATLPDLDEPEPAKPSLVVALFNASLAPDKAKRRKLAMHLFLEFLLSVPTDVRDGTLVQLGPVSIREIVVDWLQWDPSRYGANDATTGKSLQAAIADLRSMHVPVGDHGGYYVPFIVRAVSGFRLNDSISLMAQLPPGSHVGPSIDRATLRFLCGGAKRSPKGKRQQGAFAASRLYIALAFDWDRHGAFTVPYAQTGRKYKLIRPTRPAAVRDDNGRVLDINGNVISRSNGAPVDTPFHPKAVLTGEREPNPSRLRYPPKSRDDLVSMTFWPIPSANVRPYRRRAIDAALLLEESGICVIERLGSSGDRFPWRITPPDHS